MTDIAAVGQLYGIEIRELEHWIAEAWVLPEAGAAGYVFHEVDVARVRLIVEMKRELALDEEAIPLVLRLLDQLYALRRRLKAVTAALDTLPPELRAAVMAQIEGQE
jgi:chaperone modulatory protein CbpM